MSTQVQLQRTMSASSDQIRSALGEGGQRELPVPPALSGFVRGPLIISDTRTWQGDTADVLIEIKGQPIRITGTVTLLPANTQCTVDVNLAVDADLPFVGSMVEGMVAPEVKALIERELDAITA